MEQGIAEIKLHQHAESMNFAYSDPNKNCSEISDGGDSLKVKRYFSADESQRNIAKLECNHG